MFFLLNLVDEKEPESLFFICPVSNRIEEEDRFTIFKRFFISFIMLSLYINGHFSHFVSCFYHPPGGKTPLGALRYSWHPPLLVGRWALCTAVHSEILCGAAWCKRAAFRTTRLGVEICVYIHDQFNSLSHSHTYTFFFCVYICIYFLWVNNVCVHLHLAIYTSTWMFIQIGTYYILLQGVMIPNLWIPKSNESTSQMRWDSEFSSRCTRNLRNLMRSKGRWRNSQQGPW